MAGLGAAELGRAGVQTWQVVSHAGLGWQVCLAAAIDQLVGVQDGVVGEHEGGGQHHLEEQCHQVCRGWGGWFQ